MNLNFENKVYPMLNKTNIECLLLKNDEMLEQLTECSCDVSEILIKFSDSECLISVRPEREELIFESVSEYDHNVYNRKIKPVTGVFEFLHAEYDENKLDDLQFRFDDILLDIGASEYNLIACLSFVDFIPDETKDLPKLNIEKS